MNVTLYHEYRELELPHNEKSVLLALAARSGRGMREAYPSIATLARDTGMGTTRVRLALRALEGRGLLVPMKGKKGGGHHGTSYELQPNARPLPLDFSSPTALDVQPNGFDPPAQHPSVAKGIEEGKREGKIAPLLADSNHDGEALLLECWNDYLRIFGKDYRFVRGKKNVDHLRALIPHIEKFVGRVDPIAVRECFQIAMEEMSEDGWINGKAGKGKHDFPAIVFNWDRVKEYWDKREGVTVDD